MSFQKERVLVPASACTISPDGIAVDASVWMASYELRLERGRRPEPSPMPCISPAVPPENRDNARRYLETTPLKRNSPRPR